MLGIFIYESHRSIKKGKRSAQEINYNVQGLIPLSSLWSLEHLKKVHYPTLLRASRCAAQNVSQISVFANFLGKYIFFSKKEKEVECLFFFKFLIQRYIIIMLVWVLVVDYKLSLENYIFFKRVSQNKGGFTVSTGIFMSSTQSYWPE